MTSAVVRFAVLLAVVGVAVGWRTTQKTPVVVASDGTAKPTGRLQEHIAPPKCKAGFKNVLTRQLYETENRVLTSRKTVMCFCDNFVFVRLYIKREHIIRKRIKRECIF